VSNITQFPGSHARQPVFLEALTAQNMRQSLGGDAFAEGRMARSALDKCSERDLDPLAQHHTGASVHRPRPGLWIVVEEGESVSAIAVRQQPQFSS
jgi:hypothetical protein